MAISQTALDIIHTSKDIDIEYNIKLLLLFTILVYSLAAVYFSYKVEEDRLWKKLFKFLVLRIMPAPFIFFFPFMLMLMYRGIMLETLFNFMLTMYSISFVFFMLGFFVFGFETVLNWMGLQIPKEILRSKVGKK